MDNDLISRDKVLKFIEDIKCDSSIPKNYGTLLDIMRYIRKLPTIDGNDNIITPQKVLHFLEDDTFETTCCGTDITNQVYNFCPICGCELGEIEEVEGETKE